MRILPNVTLLLLVSSCGAGPGPVEHIPPNGAESPPPSAGHALVYHGGLGAVLLVNAGLGGMSPPPSTARTKLWKWSGSAWDVIDSSGPPLRNLGGVAYDSHRNVLVLFGGSYSQDLVYEDTWEWTPASGWVQRNVAGPGKRDHVKMVYDAIRRRVVLHGGQAVPPSYPAETWTWDGTTWEQQGASSGGPGGRIHFGLAYDAATQRVLLFGGVRPGAGTLGDTWAWTGSWAPAASATTPRSHAELGTSASGAILVGGFSEGAATVMQLNDQTWTAAGGGPGPRYLPALAFDPGRNVTVVYGGGNPSTDALYADTWEFNATGWRRVR